MRPGARVLEIGVGTGYNAALLAALGAEVVSVDVQPDVVEPRRRRAAPGRHHRRDGGRGRRLRRPPGRSAVRPGHRHRRGRRRSRRAGSTQLAPDGFVLAPIFHAGVHPVLRVCGPADAAGRPRRVRRRLHDRGRPAGRRLPVAAPAAAARRAAARRRPQRRPPRWGAAASPALPRPRRRGRRLGPPRHPRDEEKALPAVDCVLLDRSTPAVARPSAADGAVVGLRSPGAGVRGQSRVLPARPVGRGRRADDRGLVDHVHARRRSRAPDLGAGAVVADGQRAGVMPAGGIRRR